MCLNVPFEHLGGGMLLQLLAQTLFLFDLSTQAIFLFERRL